MLHILIYPDIEKRILKRDALLGKQKGEVIVLDDMVADISILTQYAFPSLFSTTLPVVHAKYLFEQSQDQITGELLATLVSSPTFFLLEERMMATPLFKLLEKGGAFLYKDTTPKAKPAIATIFAVTQALTAQSKKDRWLSYRGALREHSVEAILGVLYWKLKTLIDTAPKNEALKQMYTRLMKAQRDSWQKGFPLELSIEKALLE